jgi:hypothetical protein
MMCLCRVLCNDCSLSTFLILFNMFLSACIIYLVLGKKGIHMTYIKCYFSLLSKNESGLIKSPTCLSVCPPLITCEPMVDFHEIW